MSHKVIKMFYELKDAKSGEVLEANLNNELAFISGKNQIIQKLEDAVVDLKKGQDKEISIQAKDAFGEVKEELIQEVEKEQFEGIDLKIGMELFGQNPDGSQVRVIVKEIKENSVLVDFNHPYAGKDLLFFVNITENRDAKEGEIKSGMIEGSHQHKGCGCHSKEKEQQGGCCGGGHHHHKKEEKGCCGSGHHHKEEKGGCCGGGHHH